MNRHAHLEYRHKYARYVEFAKELKRDFEQGIITRACYLDCSDIWAQWWGITRKLTSAERRLYSRSRARPRAYHTNSAAVPHRNTGRACLRSNTWRRSRRSNTRRHQSLRRRRSNTRHRSRRSYRNQRSREHTRTSQRRNNVRRKRKRSDIFGDFAREGEVNYRGEHVVSIWHALYRLHTG